MWYDHHGLQPFARLKELDVLVSLSIDRGLQFLKDHLEKRTVNRNKSSNYCRAIDFVILTGQDYQWGVIMWSLVAGWLCVAQAVIINLYH